MERGKSESLLREREKEMTEQKDQSLPVEKATAHHSR
jgi:hypothetical protein